MSKQVDKMNAIRNVHVPRLHVIRLGVDHCTVRGTEELCHHLAHAVLLQYSAYRSRDRLE